MDLILILLITYFAASLRYRPSGPNSEDLNRQTTTPINGLFLLLVIFSHFMTYIPLPSHLAKLTEIWMLVKGQLIVTTFLFFSGYGIYIQIQRKGRPYLRSFPQHRLLFLWLKFAIAVTLYLGIAISTKSNLPLPRILLSYLGLATIGNSAWYIFIILFLYLLTYVAWQFSANNRQAITFILVGSGSYMLIAGWLLPEYYANTVFCYAAGMLYAHYKPQVEQIICQTCPRYLAAGLGTAVIFVASYLTCAQTNGLIRLISYQIAGIAFALCFVWLTMRFKITNPVLAYIGGPGMFAIYILQRIPMMLLRPTVVANFPVIYFTSVLAITLVIGWLFDHLYRFCWSRNATRRKISTDA